ncbi:MAG: tetratricopeptide repeat protein [Candidatus Latescibacteria bacterium]|nr:tetratricopeptide repeat protein [Candidatus Latescibacterota bacterium]
MRKSWIFLGALCVSAVSAFLSPPDAKERPPHPRQAEIDSLFRTASGSLDAGDASGAVLPLQEILSLDAKNDRAYLRLGDAYLALKNPDEAKDAFKKALSTRTTPEAYDGIGRALMQGNKIQTRQAMDYFRDALVKDRHYAEAQYHIALASWKLKDLDAKSEMERAYKMKPDDWRVHLLLAEWYQFPPVDLPNAILWFERYLQVKPDDLDNAHRLGDLYLRNRQYDKARDLLNASLQKKPDLIRELPILAQTYLGQGDFDRANELFTTYLDKVEPAERAYYDDVTFIGTLDEIKAYAATTHSEERRDFLRRFWTERDLIPATAVNECLIEHDRRVWIARNRFGEKQSPWDRRGEVYIRYGEPDYRARSDEIDYIKASDLRVQRVKERLAMGLYGTGFVFNTSSLHQGPVYPVRGPGRSSEIVAAGGTSQVPWESWIYFNLGGGIEVTFTDEMLNGRYDYAPIPFGVPGTALISNSPKVILETVASATPDYYQPDVAGPLTFGTYPAGFRGQEGKTHLEVYTGIPLSQIAYQDSGRIASLERSIALFDTTWREVLRAKDLLSFAASALSDTGAGAFIPDIRTFDLPPGDYHLAVQVTDRVSNRMQAYRQKVRLDRFGADSLQISDIELAQHVAPQTGSDPFVKNGLRVLPMPSRAYRRDQNPFLYYEVYNLRPDAAGQTRYRVDYIIRARRRENLGVKILSTLGRLIGSDEQKGELTISYELNGTQQTDFLHVELNLQEARPGSHTIRVAVTDLNSGARTERETSFRIEK